MARTDAIAIGSRPRVARTRPSAALSVLSILIDFGPFRFTPDTAMRYLTGFLVLTALLTRPASAAALDREHMRHADRLIESAIDDGQTAGAVLLVGRKDEILYHKAYGHRMVAPEKRPMRKDTLFDVASLTKPVATATAVMRLVEQGKLSLDDRVAEHIPSFGEKGKGAITVRQLLLHTGGLIPDNPVDAYRDGRSAAYRRIDALPTQAEPGSRFEYSDVGYIVLGRLVETLTGRRLDTFAKEEVFSPAGMERTRFNPPKSWREETAATMRRNQEMLVGEVHDPRAAAMDGVAGHAGLFSTAGDLGRFCRMILAGGTVGGRRVLQPATVDRMTRRHRLPNDAGTRTLAFDADTAYSSARGRRFDRTATFGHTGFTGPMFWMDPAHDVYVVFLTNRLHPDGEGDVLDLRWAVASVAAEAALGRREPSTVRTGVDVLAWRHFQRIDGDRVGLITNHTGRTRFGTRTIDLLHRSPAVDLVKIFSPEHGLGGKRSGKVTGGEDEETGVPVVSLYGDHRRPTKEMLSDVDTLLFDVQSVGTRFYTYITTMGYAMEAAAEHGARFVVLDRPNPIAPMGARGPVVDEDKLSFIAYRPLPLTHGMTVGELARLFNQRGGIGCDLSVVRMDGWNRGMWWDETGLRWPDPSPNLRNPEEAVLYPAVGLLERTNLSVGRGTDEPFERLGAPWIAPGPSTRGPARLASALNDAAIAGLRFTPIVFTPESSAFSGERCGGVHITVTDRAALRPARAGLTIAHHLERLFGDAFEAGGVLEMVGDEKTHAAWQEGVEDLRKAWEGPLGRFRKARGRHLLYE